MNTSAPEGRTHYKSEQKRATGSGGTQLRNNTSSNYRESRKPDQADFAAKGAFGSLISPLKRALRDTGYHTPTPIQEQAIPHLLNGRDMLGCAQTGTGKTAAFTLPILQYLDQQPRRPVPGKPRVLILTPTRELAAQIGDSISTYGRYVRISHTVIFGGVGQQPQVARLRRGLDIVVATPGRLLDLMQQGHVSLSEIEVFVLDEADRMLDMGFIHDIRKVIAKLPLKRQSLFFSATMAGPVVELAQTLVHNAIEVTITPEQPTVKKIVQKVLFVDKTNKGRLLVSLLGDDNLEKVIVFTRMKHMANKVAEKLNRSGISASAIHGNKSQAARTQALADFRNGKMRVLVATDIAARGIDVDNVSHVINYDLPNEPETYVHRIGRTARAGAEGDAISFCSPEERNYLRSIERLIRVRVPVDSGHGFHSDGAIVATTVESRPASQSASRGNFPRMAARPRSESGSYSRKNSRNRNSRSR